MKAGIHTWWKAASVLTKSNSKRIIILRASWLSHRVRSAGAPVLSADNLVKLHLAAKPMTFHGQCDELTYMHVNVHGHVFGFLKHIWLHILWVRSTAQAVFGGILPSSSTSARLSDAPRPRLRARARGAARCRAGVPRHRRHVLCSRTHPASPVERLNSHRATDGLVGGSAERGACIELRGGPRAEAMVLWAAARHSRPPPTTFLPDSVHTRPQGLDTHQSPPATGRGQLPCDVLRV